MYSPITKTIDEATRSRYMNADLNCRMRISHHWTLLAEISLYPDPTSRCDASAEDNPWSAEVLKCARISPVENVEKCFVSFLIGVIVRGPTASL
ncbi:MAG: hypothetical protein A4E42_01000 [Methanoregulaceae archaeon PtaU1.Bin222]|nr:MAG: hypothetical protein A4E42_01000 [Methanoregulaceae archaeon PtaU1.Bin222]